MSVSIQGVIEYVEARSGEEATGYVETFCSFPYLGNDSMLVRLLRETGEPLPERLSYSTVHELTIEVGDGSPSGYREQGTVDPEQARKWVDDGYSSWLRYDGQSLVESTEPTDLISNPDTFRGAQSFTLGALEALQSQYRRENVDEPGLVAVAPGEPLPERVVGFEGTDPEGRAQLYVSLEEGYPSFILERVIGCMKLAREAELEPRFICMLS